MESIVKQKPHLTNNTYIEEIYVTIVIDSGYTNLSSYTHNKVTHGHWTVLAHLLKNANLRNIWDYISYANGLYTIVMMYKLLT